jgi:3-hydroxyisobutyrate dehydrogenase
VIWREQRTDGVTAERVNVGFIGLGDMGGRIAHRILDAGFPLTVFDKREVACRELADRGASVAADVRQLADASDVVCICVVDDKQLRTVVHELRGGLKPGDTLIIHSSVMPATAREVEAELAGTDVGVIDAPVSGSRPAADAGTLTVMVGGDPATFEAVAPLLAAYASNVIQAGPIGSGQALKIANNVMLHMNHLIALEAVRFARSQGLDESVLIAAANISSGRSWVTETWGLIDSMFSDHPLAGSDAIYPLMSKEMWNSVNISRETMTSMPLTALGTQVSEAYFRERERDLSR